MKDFFKRPTVQFIARTLLYTGILIMLVYLYSYTQSGGAHFIYNEF
ncbi:MAG: teichoic acid D-Ala incorporation-associated protein DltX [Streptococcaceae bacterium]|nr:teichoic acid D-Ala incorporation-associated protein DltX [Streptococcaceae bacterium]